jgi:hypothetical protein
MIVCGTLFNLLQVAELARLQGDDKTLHRDRTFTHLSVHISASRYLQWGQPTDLQNPFPIRLPLTLLLCLGPALAQFTNTPRHPSLLHTPTQLTLTHLVRRQILGVTMPSTLVAIAIPSLTTRNIMKSMARAVASGLRTSFRMINMISLLRVVCQPQCRYLPRRLLPLVCLSED